MPALPPLFRRRYTAPGSAPGSHEAMPDGAPPVIHVIRYGPDEIEEWEANPDSVLDVELRGGTVTWIDVLGLGDGSLVTAMGERFGIHRLAVSDILNVGQRPKADDYGNSLLFVARMVGRTKDALTWEQVSIFVLPGLVITFQEKPEECLEPLRLRLRSGRKQLRASGSGYLASMALDTAVDGYFPILEHYGDRLEELESEILNAPTQALLSEVYMVKRELSTFRRSVWPLREVLSHVLREPHPVLGAETQPYLRDTTDHVMQVVDVLETYRELASSLIDVHLSMLGQRTNETMRVLTVIATIFIPLTFVAGIYGMNFDTSLPGNLPELTLPYGYVIFWGVCLVIAVGLLVVFRRLGWLGGKD